MHIDEELDGTQPGPEGATVENRDNTAPEQEDDQLNNDNVEGGEGAAEGEVVTEEGEGEKPAKPEKKKQSWELRRIGELTAKQREAERRAADAEAELARLRKKPVDAADSDDAPLSTDEIRRQERESIRAEERTAAEQARFNQACNDLFDKGVAEVDGFAEAVTAFNQALGSEAANRNDFYEAIIELENGHQVFADLGSNLEEADRLLRMSPVKMAMELAKMSAKVAKPAAPAPKPLSKAPAPVTPIGGAARAASRIDDPDVPMDKFADDFLKLMANRGR